MTSALENFPAVIYLHPYALLNAFGSYPDSDEMFDIIEFCLERDSCTVGAETLAEFYESETFKDPVSSDPAFWTLVTRIEGLSTFPEESLDRSIGPEVVKLHSEKCKSVDSLVLGDLAGIEDSAILGIPSTGDWWNSAPEEVPVSNLYIRSVDKFDDSTLHRLSFVRSGKITINSIDIQRDRLFSNLVFRDGWLSGSSKLVGDRADISKKVYDHLCVLNDFVFFRWENETNENRQAIAASQGVDISPESPNTHKNSSAMKAHYFDSPDGSVLCEWHTKLDRQRNRIYFRWTPEYIFVAILTDHLPI